MEEPCEEMNEINGQPAKGGSGLIKGRWGGRGGVAQKIIRQYLIRVEAFSVRLSTRMSPGESLTTFQGIISHVCVWGKGHH